MRVTLSGVAERAGQQAVEVARRRSRRPASESDRRADRASAGRASRRSARSGARTRRARAARPRRALRPSSCPSPARETARRAGGAAAQAGELLARRVSRTPLYGSYSASPDSASALTIVVAVPGVTPSAEATCPIGTSRCVGAAAPTGPDRSPSGSSRPCSTGACRRYYPTELSLDVERDRDARRQAPLRARALRDDRRSLRLHHRRPVVRAGPALEAAAGRALAAPRPGARALDLATGTGDIAFALAARGARVVGLDITQRMIELARAKAGRPRRRAPAFLVGDMLALPFPAGIVRHRHDRLRSAKRARTCARRSTKSHRVLAPGGAALSLDFNRPANRVVRGVYLAYLTVVGGALGWMLHRDPDTYRYIPASIRRYPGAEAVARMFEARGFAGVRALSRARRPDGDSPSPTRQARHSMELDTSKWSGEGDVHAAAHRAPARVAGVRYVRVEDAPASRVGGRLQLHQQRVVRGVRDRIERREPITRLRHLSRRPDGRPRRLMTMPGSRPALTGIAGIGAPDYCRRGHAAVSPGRADHPALPDPRLQAGRDGPDLRGWAREPRRAIGVMPTRASVVPIRAA